MVISPFYFLLFVYLVGSFIGLILGVGNSGFVLLDSFYSVSPSSFYYAFAFDIVVLVFLSVTFELSRNQCRFPFQRFSLNSGWGRFIILHQLAFIFFVVFTGAGIAGSGFSFGGFNIFNYYFILLSPDILAFIMLPLLRSKRQFIIGVAVLLLSFLIRGWMGGVLFFIVMLLVRIYPFKLRIPNMILCLSCFILVLALLPFLDALKWGVRLGFSLSQIFANAIDNFSFDGYMVVIERLVFRFSHINNTALVIENSDFFRSSYDSGYFKPYWQNGLLYETVCRVVGDCGKHLNKFIVESFYDPHGKDWDVDPGVGGWLAILASKSIALLAMFVTLFFFVYWMALKYLPDRAIVVFFSFSLIYLFHGWLSPFFNVALYLVLFVIFFRVKWVTSVSRLRS